MTTPRALLSRPTRRRRTRKWMLRRFWTASSRLRSTRSAPSKRVMMQSLRRPPSRRATRRRCSLTVRRPFSASGPIGASSWTGCAPALWRAARQAREHLLLNRTMSNRRDSGMADFRELEQESGWSAEDSDLALIGPVDSRVHETRTTQFPWNTLVHLCRDFGRGGCAGCTGTLISPRRILTAAHCIWSMARGMAPRRIFAMPGRRNRDDIPYGAYRSREYWVPRGFIHGPRRAGWDWGLIILERPAPLDRYMRLRPLSDEAIGRLARTGRVAIAGYPADRPLGTMWRDSERLIRFDDRRMFHTVDTCPGHSGSPIVAR